MTSRRPDFAGDLGPRRREADRLLLGNRRAPWDVLVVGGGVTGVGVALDAASRGLSVALVEAHDLAFGTSRWSSKLVHGGLRYLASGRVGIAWESAVERNHLMTTIAPHLVSPLTQAIPITSRGAATLVHSGLVLGDLLRRGARTPKTVLAPPRRIHPDDLARLCPAVSLDGVKGAWTSQDGQLVDDARLVVAIARTAAAHGATIATGVRAEEITGRGARLIDTLTGESFDVAARTVINATGVWAGTVDPSISVRPSRGAHLVVPAARLGNPTAALTVPVAGSHSRFVFAIPAQLGRVHIGLTDTDAPGPVPDVPTATDDDVDFILDMINTALARPLSRADIVGTYAGLRPLLESEGATADVSREHSVTRNGDGVITVVGGKLTTYRKMASDALDLAVEHGGLDAHPCVTASIPLIGARGPRNRRLPAALLARHGGEADRVVAMSTVGAPLAPIAPGIDVTRAEIEFAVTAEGARDADDILDRRTRIGLVEADAVRARPAVVHILDQIGAAHTA